MDKETDEMLYAEAVELAYAAFEDPDDDHVACIYARLVAHYSAWVAMGLRRRIDMTSAGPIGVRSSSGSRMAGLLHLPPSRGPFLRIFLGKSCNHAIRDSSRQYVRPLSDRLRHDSDGSCGFTN